jgi:hypothetical protein
MADSNEKPLIDFDLPPVTVSSMPAKDPLNNVTQKTMEKENSFGTAQQEFGVFRSTPAIQFETSTGPLGNVMDPKPAFSVGKQDTADVLEFKYLASASLSQSSQQSFFDNPQSAIENSMPAFHVDAPLSSQQSFFDNPQSAIENSMPAFHVDAPLSSQQSFVDPSKSVHDNLGDISLSTQQSFLEPTNDQRMSPQSLIDTPLLLHQSVKDPNMTTPQDYHHPSQLPQVTLNDHSKLSENEMVGAFQRLSTGSQIVQDPNDVNRIPSTSNLFSPAVALEQIPSFNSLNVQKQESAAHQHLLPSLTLTDMIVQEHQQQVYCI